MEDAADARDLDQAAIARIIAGQQDSAEAAARARFRAMRGRRAVTPGGNPAEMPGDRRIPGQPARPAPRGRHAGGTGTGARQAAYAPAHARRDGLATYTLAEHPGW
jgi:hypothetical protein